MTIIKTIKNTILKMINDIYINDSGVYMGELGSKLTNRYPDFDVSLPDSKHLYSSKHQDVWHQADKTSG